MLNGLKGTHIATGYPVEVDLSKKELMLIEAATGNINDNWTNAMELLYVRTGIEIIGQVDIERIIINGVDKRFHQVYNSIKSVRKTEPDNQKDLTDL